MKFSTAKEHRDFFQKHGWIEFEEFLSYQQLAELNQAINKEMAKRTGDLEEKVPFLSSEKVFLQGRDLWRGNDFIKKFVVQPRLAEVVEELIEKKPLRLGCDQLFPPCQEALFPQESSQIYSKFLKQTETLQAVSCYQGIACGMMIALNEEENKGDEGERDISLEGANLFPSKPGNVLLFQPNIPLNWSYLFHYPKRRYLLIIYTLANAYYKLEPSDPHTHLLKRLGYVFNDKLSDKLNPIVFR